MEFCVRRVALSTAIIALGLSACTKREDAVRPGTAAAPVVDVSTDRVHARESWVVGVAKDPAGLKTLAQSNPGWGKLFTSDPAGALDEFAGAVKSGGPADSARMGAARAALELAEAHLALGTMVAGLTQTLATAKTDAGGAEGAAWRIYLAARLAQREGKDPSAALQRLIPGTSVDSLAAALKPGATGPLSLLLAGKAAGEVSLPAGATPEYAERLQIAALVATGSASEAIARYARVTAAVPDAIVGAGDTPITFRDPMVADLGARVAALQCLELVGAGPGWLGLLKARAQLILGQAVAARATLEALRAAPPTTAGLADLVLTDALSADDLKLETIALLARAQAASGDLVAGKATAAGLPVDTISHRVLRTWAAVGAGDAFDLGAFPEDRSVLARAVGAEVDALGAAATGGADVAALNLVERYVDAVERRFAEAATLGGMPEVALKHLENAEDKAASFAPSPRNQIAALAHAARENIRIGRPRVSLKYLSRLAERFPAVAAPADMLRDLLTIRAMDQEGGAASGQ